LAFVGGLDFLHKIVRRPDCENNIKKFLPRAGNVLAVEAVQNAFFLQFLERLPDGIDCRTFPRMLNGENYSCKILI
jgi:hypothetical protein